MLSLNTALEIRKKLAKDNPQKYEIYLADTYNNLGNLHSDLNNYESALESFSKALEIYKQLSKDNAKKHKPKIAGTLSNLGNLQSNLNNYTKALKLSLIHI